MGGKSGLDHEGGSESLDFVLEREGWSVVRGEDGYRMERASASRDSSGTDGGTRDFLDSFAQRDSMKQACLLTVAEYQSELSEFVFLRTKSGTQLDGDTVAKKLCIELA